MSEPDSKIIESSSVREILIRGRWIEILPHSFSYDEQARTVTFSPISGGIQTESTSLVEAVRWPMPPITSVHS